MAIEPKFVIQLMSILLLFSSAEAQWQDPWIVPPPPGSTALDYTTITVNGGSATMAIREKIPVDRTPTAIVKYSGATKPTFGGCVIFQFNDISGELTLINSLDFESGTINSPCFFFINGDFRTLSVTVLDDNDNVPYFTNAPSEALTWEENKSGMVYEFRAIDLDAGDNATLKYTYKVLIGNPIRFQMVQGGTGNNLKTGRLMVVDGQELDYETENFYLFSITVTDREVDSLSSTIQVSLNVIDMKDMAPVWTKQVPIINVQEELSVGTPVFNVAARDGDTSVNFNDTIVYTMSDDNFDIDRYTGVIMIKQRIDRDIADFDPYFDLIITATCENYPDNSSWTSSTVVINDVNDNSALLDINVYDYTEVDEGFVGRLSEFDIEINDPDQKENGIYNVAILGPPEITRYLLLTPTIGRNSISCNIRITSPDLLDYEVPEKRKFSFTIQTTNTAPMYQSTSSTSSSTVNVYSKDVNDNTPVFNNAESDGNYVISIIENMEPLTQVTQIVASDADISPEFGTPSIRFSFVENLDYLTVDNVTGDIMIAAKGNIDRETIGPSLSYTLRAADMYGQIMNGTIIGRWKYANLLVIIQDVNDDPPRFNSLDTGTFEVSEGEDANFLVVERILALDRDEVPDLEIYVNWTCSRFFKDRVTLQQIPEEWTKTFNFNVEDRPDVNNVIGKVQVGNSSLPPGNCADCGSTPLDREKFDQVQLCLSVYDMNTELNTAYDEVTITINIGDINDNDPLFLLTFGNFSVVENTTSPTLNLGYTLATDSDVDNTITYTIGPCTNEGLSYVTVNSSTGQINMIAIIDYETIQLIDCTVTATDSGTPPRSSSLPIRINVIDINDNSPIFDDDLLQLLANPLRMYENSIKTTPTGSPVLCDFVTGLCLPGLHASDADAGDFGNVKYLFAPNNVEGVDEFEIDLDSGNMTVRNGPLLDFEKKRTYSFFVEARDYYRSTLTGSNWEYQRVNISLMDVNDNAPVLPNTPFTSCFSSPLESLTKDQTVVEILGSDADEPDTNRSQMVFTLISQSRIDGQNRCPNLFKISTFNYTTGNVTVNVDNLLDCWGNYQIEVQANDLGDKDILGVQYSEIKQYRICVQDVNNNVPVFVFPNVEGSTVINVQENAIVGEILVHDGGIQTVMKATDVDDGENGRVSYRWRDPSTSAIFELDADTGYVFLASPLDRSKNSSYNLAIIAYDHGTPSSLETTTTLRINVRISNKKQPYFSESGGQILSFTENQNETNSFQEATDPDNLNLYPGEDSYIICYYIACGNSQYFQLANATDNKLSTKQPVDREDPPDVLYVVIGTGNIGIGTPCPSTGPSTCSGIDVSSVYYHNISINILDEKDCAPEFYTPLSGGITAGDKPSKTVFTMNVMDRDLDDVDECRIEEQFQSSDTSIGGLTTPFTLRNTNPFDVFLNFDVQDSMKGFFTLNVTCYDLGKNYNRTNIKIYVVKQENKINIFFENEADTVQNNRNYIEDVFTQVYGYVCNIESISQDPTDSDGTVITTAVTHFVDQNKDEPVLASVILGLKNDYNKTVEIRRLLAVRGVSFKGIGTLNSPTDTTQQLYMILFIIACIALVALIVLLFFLVVKTTDLNRRVKALSSPTTFGSQDSGLNRIGAVVPNTNKHTIEGSNPVWSVEGHMVDDYDEMMVRKNDPQFDNMSESSGDSVLIGVENNKEFDGFMGNVIRRNPLLDLQQEPVDSFDVPSNTKSTKRTAPPPPIPLSLPEPPGETNDDDDDSYTYLEEKEAIDANFSFGSNKLTEL